MKQLQDLNLLIVENHQDTRLLFEEVFRGEGARVMGTASVLEAAQIFACFQPDLVVCDIALPQWDGYALMHYMKDKQTAIGRYLPVIAVTAFVSGRMGDPILEAGFDAYLCKPVDIEQLVAQVVQLIHQYGYRSLQLPCSAVILPLSLQTICSSSITKTTLLQG